MADFKVHLLTASAVGSLTAAGFHEAGVGGSGEVLLWSTMGAVGGILPDIDSDHSLPTQILFNGLGVFLAFLGIFTHVSRFSLVELFVIWMCFYALVRYPAYQLFARFTIHRGIIHSVPAGVFFWLATTALCARMLGMGDFTAWVSGFFVFLGYLVHLLLDELYSVDLVHAEVKESFGTAMKLGRLQDMTSTLLIYVLVAAMFFLTPSPQKFITTFSSAKFYQRIEQRLLPRDGWFAGFFGERP